MSQPAPGSRVLMTADAVGGVWTYALELARGLARHGVAVTLAVMGPAPSAAQRAEAEAVAHLELCAEPFRLEWMDAPWDDVAAAGAWLLELEARVRPAVVHLNGYAHGALPFRAPVLVVGHSCVLSWWRAVHGEDAPPAWDRYRAEVARGLRAADLVVAPTRAMLDALATHYGPLAPGSRVIANGRDPSAYAPAARKEPFVLSAGRLWDPAKNLEALCRAAPALPWPVRVAGDARNSDGRAADVRGVEWLGRLEAPALAAQYARAAIYALPCRYEPFGLSALEAALSGCALVLGDVPSLREVWGDAARFVPPNDPAALAAALGALAADEPARAALGRAARARAEAYTNERCAAAYAALYRDLTLARRARRAHPEASPCAS